MKVLAGDVGGTKTLLQITEADPHTLRYTVLREERFDSRAFDDLAPLVQQFLATAEHSDIAAACFGVAGPVTVLADGQRAELTNLPWILDSQRLQQRLDLPQVGLVNDFAAVGYAIDGLDAGQLAPLQPVEATPGGPRVVLGAGTGLGVAQLFQCRGRYDVQPTEAGHAAFAPADEEQVELLRFLRAEYGRVSCERLLSGAGIEAIYRFMTQREETGDSEVLAAPDPAAAISALAMAGSDAAAARTLKLFATIYGSVAGDLALTNLATGGVYIAGGIAPKILPFMSEGHFLRAFNDKGRMAPLTRGMPVHVITEEKAGLLGAALAALRLAEPSH